MTEKISRRTGILWWTVGLAGALAAPKISKFIFPEKVAKLEFMTSEETLGKIRRFKEERFDRDIPVEVEKQKLLIVWPKTKDT